MPHVTPAQEDGLLLSLRTLSDDQLVTRLKGLAARERRATALLVAHLAEMDTRDVYLRAGYSSLFAFCCDVLALSEHEALNRIEAARTARRFPLVLALLGSGEVTLTTVRLLGPHLTKANHARVLEAARGKRKAEVEEIVARLSPRADVPASVRRLPQPPAASTGSGPLAVPAEVVPAAVPFALDSVAPFPAPSEASPSVGPGGPVVPMMRSAAVRPLSPDRYRYQLTIGGATLEKLRFAKDLLRHALPSGDDEAVLDRALSALITEVVRRKVGAERGVGSSPDQESSADRPARSSGTAAGGRGRADADSRGIIVAVKRVVWARDRGRCAFVGADGRRCGERAFVEFHHVKPYAVGGRPTVANIQLRCKCHNRYEARVFFARGIDEAAPAPESCAGTGLECSHPHAHPAGRSGTSRRGEMDIRGAGRANGGCGRAACRRTAGLGMNPGAVQGHLANAMAK
jgi:hypothetical protein